MIEDSGPPGWIDHVVWWHVYPLGFLGADTTGADRRPGRTLADIEPWLDYVIALGLNGILLGPIFESETHGYDTIDYYQVDSRLGTDTDLERLLDAARERGIRVILDGVFNHVGRSFKPPTQLSARSDDLLRRTSSGEVATFEGHAQLVELNHDDDRVVDLVVGVMDHWLSRGVDGWRLDAAYAVSNEFWARVLARVRPAYPAAYFVGEYIQGDYAAAVRDGGLDSVTQYELWQAVWHGINEKNLYELDWALTRHNQFLTTFIPFTFIGNHDVTRLASQIDDVRHHPHALVLLMTLGGTPAVYYGDERGERGIKEARFGGDDAIRPKYPPSPADFGVGGTASLALHHELIGLRRRSPWLVRAASRTISLTNTLYVYESLSGDESLFVALNLSDELQIVEVPGPASVIAGAAHRTERGWQLSSHGWAIFE